MPSYSDQIDDIGYNFLNIRKEQRALTLSRKERQRFARIFNLLYPFFALWYITIPLIALSPRARKALYTRFIRRYFRIYFLIKGVSPYPAIEPLPEKITRPTLFLAVRNHNFEPFFIYQLFKYPIVVPIKAHFNHYFMLNKFRHPKFGRSFSAMSYPDGDLDLNLPNIKTLLEAGYPVLAYINHEFANPLQRRKVYLFRALQELLESGIDIYFIDTGQFSLYPTANFINPVLVPYYLATKDQVMEGIDTSKPSEVYGSIAQFFGFSQYELIG